MRQKFKILVKRSSMLLLLLLVFFVGDRKLLNGNFLLNAKFKKGYVCMYLEENPFLCFSELIRNNRKN